MKNEKISKETNTKKQASKLKQAMIAVAITLAVITAGVFVVYPLYTYFHTGINLYFPESEPDVAKESDSIDYNPDNGALYVNDEIIVMTITGVDQSAVESLAKSYNAKIIASLDHIGFYRFRFDEKMKYEELQSLIKRLKKEEIVDDAYINTVFEVAPDSSDEEFKKREPFYPNDPWGSDDWDMEVPRGKNWGAEAIRAPAAWGYLDELASVKVGLIDSMVNTNHEDINVSAFLTFTESESTTMSVNANKVAPDNHGTHVAGTIAAAWNKVGVTGIAGDKVNLYYSAAYYTRDNKVLVDYYDAFNYLAAISTLVERNIKAINISQNTSRLIGFAASRGNSNAISRLRQNAEIAGNGIRRLVENGKEFVICVAAGNSNSTVYYKDDKAPYGYKEKRTWWKIFDFGEKGDSQAKYNNFLNLIKDETVKGRIIVVGSVGINKNKSTSNETRYSYSYFSNIGNRVDVVGPGEKIYSSYVKGYNTMSGTSMATPHVTGVAGLIFAANPQLTGAEVKKILLASTTGRFYYTDGYSGMVDAEAAVIHALQTREHSVNRVIKSETSDGLDVCFLVDTTGSMGDDIANAKENMARILDELTTKSESFRVALIDYRDFPERGKSQDYPAKVQLEFSNDRELITQAIYALNLGHGGDTQETVFSGLMAAVGLGWRAKSTKVIIILGDAPPHDPEPNTGYTLNSVMASLYNADVKVDIGASDDRVLGDSNDSLIKVYSIGTDASSAAEEIFRQISDMTGGTYTGVDSALEVSDAIIHSIEQIEITPTKNVTAQFGMDCSGEIIEIFKDGKFAFEKTLDGSGSVKLENMELTSYDWSIPRLMISGAARISESGKTARINFDKTPWYQFAIMLWQRERVPFIAYGIGTALLIIVLFAVARKIKNRSKIRKQLKVVQHVSAFDKPSEQPAYICQNCGKEYEKQAKFCGKCGEKIHT